VNPRFKHRTDIPYPALEAKTNAETGVRQYFTPCGPAFSVTTILGMLPKPGIDAWRLRVGDEEADRIKNEAAQVGTYTHNRMEAYVRDEPYVPADDPLESQAEAMFKIIKLIGLSKVTSIWGIEEALHLENLYAGRCDLICEYRRKPTILDYKNSSYFKPEDYIEHYKLQIAMYAIAHDWMFPQVQPIEQGVIMIGIRPNEKFKIPARIQTFVMDTPELDVYREKALDVVQNFHDGVYGFPNS